MRHRENELRVDRVLLRKLALDDRTFQYPSVPGRDLLVVALLDTNLSEPVPFVEAARRRVANLNMHIDICQSHSRMGCRCLEDMLETFGSDVSVSVGLQDRIWLD